MPTPAMRALPASGASAPSRAADALLILPIAAVALGQPQIVRGVSIGDVCLVLFVVSATVLLRGRARELLDVPWLSSLLAFVAWTLVGAAYLLASGEPAFSILEFGKSFAKLLLYPSAALLLTVVLRRATPGRVAKLLGAWCVVSALCALALYAAILARVPAARELVCVDISRDECRTYFYEERWFGAPGEQDLTRGAHLRASGLAREPSTLGLLLSLALGYLLLATQPRTASQWLVVAVLFAAALLTYSLTALLLLAAVLAVATLSSGRRGLLLIAAALGVTLLLAALPPVRSSLGGVDAIRLAALLRGAPDHSAQLRLITGWQLAYELLELQPITGVGLGHFDRRIEEVQDRVHLGALVNNRTQGWSVPGHLLATTGLVGVVLFSILVVRALRPFQAHGAIFVLAMLGDATVLGGVFWVFLVLYGTAAESSRADASATA